MKVLFLTMVAMLGLTASGPVLATTPPSPPPVASPTATPSSTPTPEPDCPAPTEGTLLLRNEDMGYCFLYPDHLFRVDPFSTEVCLGPELPAMACHSNVAQIEVTDATGLTAGQMADEVIALAGTGIERSTAKVAGEDAVILHGVPAQDLLRDILIVHENQLYRLRFVVPDPADPAAVERFDRLYAMVIDSFNFLPRPQ